MELVVSLEKIFCLDSIIERMKEEVNEKKEFICQLEQSKTDDEKMLTSLRVQLKTLQEHSSQQAKTIGSFSENKKEMELTIGHMKEDISSKSNHIHFLEGQIDNLNSTVSVQKEKLDKHQKECDNHNLILQVKTEKLESVECCIKKMSEDLKEKEIQIQNLEAKSLESEEVSGSLNIKMKVMENQLLEKSSALEEKQKTIEKLEHSVGDLEREINSTSDILMKEKFDSKALEQQLHSFKEKYEIQLENCEKGLKELSLKNDTVLKLESEIEKQNGKIDEYSKINCELKSLNSELLKDIKLKSINIDILNENLTMRNNTISDLENNVVKLSEDLKTSYNKLDSLSKSHVKWTLDVSAKSEEINALNDENKLLKNSLMKREQTITEIQNKNCELEERLAFLLEELEHMKSKLVKLKDMEEEVVNLKKELDSCCLNIGTRDKKIHELEVLSKNLQSDNSLKDGIISDLKPLNEILEKKKDYYKKHCDKLNEILKVKKLMLEELKESNLKNERKCQEYEKGLIDAREKMKIKYNEAQGILKSKYEEKFGILEEEAQKKFKVLSREYQNCVNERDLMKKLYSDVNKELQETKRKLGNYVESPFRIIQGVHNSPLTKSLSIEHFKRISSPTFDDDSLISSCSKSGSPKEDRRLSVRSVPPGLGKVFPAAEEEGELFDNRYLLDLKRGICNVGEDPARLSTLMSRNSLCPPHLKSSYPAETQFLGSASVREDDIKRGTVQCPPISSTQKRSKNQIIYKKPGPPTPSKIGSRSSQQGRDSGLSQRTLKEPNKRDDASHIKGTPNKIKSLLTKRKDEAKKNS